MTQIVLVPTLQRGNAYPPASTPTPSKKYATIPPMDTLAITDKLIAAGTPEPQARAQVEVAQEIAQEIRHESQDAKQDLATKAELQRVELSLKAEMQELKAEMRAAEARLSWRMVGAMTAIMVANGVLYAMFG